jgi:hypothetical protein
MMLAALIGELRPPHEMARCQLEQEIASTMLAGVVAV